MQGGYNISYKRNFLIRKGRKRYYTLSFKYKFPEDNDTVYFSYSLPYTYTRLQKFLNGLDENKRYKTFYKRTKLCRTLAKNRCDLLTITNPSKDENDKKVIILTSRVHPGETVGSFKI